MYLIKIEIQLWITWFQSNRQATLQILMSPRLFTLRNVFLCLNQLKDILGEEKSIWTITLRKLRIWGKNSRPRSQIVLFCSQEAGVRSIAREWRKKWAKTKLVHLGRQNASASMLGRLPPPHLIDLQSGGGRLGEAADERSVHVCMCVCVWQVKGVISKLGSCIYIRGVLLRRRRCSDLRDVVYIS